MLDESSCKIKSTINDNITFKKTLFSEKLGNANHESFTFPPKKPFLNLLKYRKVKIACNLSSYISKNIVEEDIYIFSISVSSINNYIKDHDSTQYCNHILRILLENKKHKLFLFFLDTIFSSYILSSGNIIFAKPIEKEQLNEIYNFKFIYNINENKIEHISEEQINQLTLEQLDYVYSLEIRKKENLFQTQNKSLIKMFHNLTIASNLKKLNYIRTQFQKNNLYFKKINLDHMGMDYFNNIIADATYFGGYKIFCNVYESQQLLLKTNLIYRLVRKQTYYDVYNSMHLPKDSNFLLKVFSGNPHRRGIKMYDNLEIKIDEIIFKNPSSIYFQDNKSDKLINLLEYYSNRWGLKVKAEEQPILVQHYYKRDLKTGKRTFEKELFYLPQFVYVVGKFDDEKANISTLILNPRERYDLINKVMTELNQLNTKENEIGYKLLTFDSYVLKTPLIEFKNKEQRIPDIQTGRFKVCKAEPLENVEMKEWLIFLMDTTFEEANNIYLRMSTASHTLSIKISNPKDLPIEVPERSTT